MKVIIIVIAAVLALLTSCGSGSSEFSWLYTVDRNHNGTMDGYEDTNMNGIDDGAEGFVLPDIKPALDNGDSGGPQMS